MREEGRRADRVCGMHAANVMQPNNDIFEPVKVFKSIITLSHPMALRGCCPPGHSGPEAERGHVGARRRHILWRHTTARVREGVSPAPSACSASQRPWKTKRIASVSACLGRQFNALPPHRAVISVNDRR